MARTVDSRRDGRSRSRRSTIQSRRTVDCRRLRLATGDRQLRADDGAEAGGFRGLMEPRRAVDAVAIEQRHRGIAESGRALDERFGQRRAAQK